MPKQKRLRSLMIEKQVHVKELSRETGINLGTLYKKMQGLSDFTFSEVYEISRALGIENPLEVFTPEPAPDAGQLEDLLK